MGIDWEYILDAEDDLDVAYDNYVAKALELDEQLEKEQQYSSGIWRGKEVKIKNIWSGYQFSESQLKKLFNDEVIEFYCEVHGNEQKVVGKLEEQTLGGNSFIGFSPNWSK